MIHQVTEGFRREKWKNREEFWGIRRSTGGSKQLFLLSIDAFFTEEEGSGIYTPSRLLAMIPNERVSQGAEMENAFLSSYVFFFLLPCC
jgi:hypothetical protein